ncbi:hypothetical protein [Thalassospira lohafexi]|uniref:Uncharacterized protein n=1 Tax=Thalassospira lohafexi TaxID=744227 RepID=A0A2N3L0H8_9PROT|nr:hypothetical protein [Thalassospira lohafexi]PKR56298.1 hypothetical protein COO92_21550 [Thalassospira lohafexi]
MENLSGVGNPGVSMAQAILEDAISTDVPIVAILGQSLGHEPEEADRICLKALERLQIDGSSWNDLFSKGKIDAEFYDWLNERFERRSPPIELTAISDAHFSAVFTSSIDPILRNLFETDGRQPETILVGDPPPPVTRSKLRPRLYYLYGMTGAGQFQPPISKLALRARHAQHATPMLNTLFDVATPLGIIVIDGLRSGSDWLNLSDLIGQLSMAPTQSVLWYGPDPEFEGDDAEFFSELVESGIILRDERSLGTAIAEAEALNGSAKLHSWNEPGIVSFADGQKLVTTPSMRLSTESSASIIDDAWLDPLQPVNEAEQLEKFALFHSIPSSIRPLLNGVRRGFAIKRDFEDDLWKTVGKAIVNHANEKGAIVLSGQSGIGKSVALYRLASTIRSDRLAAVLFARDRVPQAVEVAPFLTEVDKLNQVTVLIVDALDAPKRYDALLESFRSRGHRIVIVGTSYVSELAMNRHDGRLISVTPVLSPDERDAMVTLVQSNGLDIDFKVQSANSEHALAYFFWMLPQSRARLARGLGLEARRTERTVRERGKEKRSAKRLTDMAHAFLQAGYNTKVPILQQAPTTDEESDSAVKLIDYIMVCSRLHRWVPINLVLRALLSKSLVSHSGLDTELIRDLFEGYDLFRWRYHDNSDDQLLVGARLQVEAQLICDQRIGGPVQESRKILELIASATRAGTEGGEEARFVADIVYALGPDGPLGTRYQDTYGEIAAALTSLRKDRGVRSARLMLQEATLRRHFIRNNSSKIPDDDQWQLLDEAREAVEEALTDISSPKNSLRAARRTIDYLWVERAATYGYLATTASKNKKPADLVWAHYLAAREAARNATGRVDTYHPIDISLWIPIQILESKPNLGLEREAELRADIISSIDMVSEEELEFGQMEVFQRQRLRSAELLENETLSEEAFDALANAGSTVGYYFRAKSLAPQRNAMEAAVTNAQLNQAKAASDYLLQNSEYVFDDPRCLWLLLNCLWLWKTGEWLFRGLRQPLPFADTDRAQILDVLTDLSTASGKDLSPKFRYLHAVLNWLTGDEAGAIQKFRQLAQDTEYVEGKRVLRRNVITDDEKQPIAYSGIVERQIGDNRWSVHVRELNRKIDLVEGRWIQNVSIGTEIKKFAIAFNYLGPIADELR